MAKTAYVKTALTGGGADALDSIDGAGLTNNDIAFVFVSNVEYNYILDADNGGAESSPDIIAPDTNAGDKRWVLQGKRLASLQLDTGATVNEFSTDGTLGGNSDSAVPTEKAVKTYADNAMEKVSEVNVSSDCTYVDFTGLDGNSVWFYVLHGTMKNPTGSAEEYYLYVNGDTTDTNYYLQYLDVYGTTVSANLVNSPPMAYAPSGASTLSVVHITKSPTGYFQYVAHEGRHQSNVFLNLRAGIKANATISNITSLRVQAQQSNGIGAGSKLILFKVRRG